MLRKESRHLGFLRNGVLQNVLSSFHTWAWASEPRVSISTSKPWSEGSEGHTRNAMGTQRPWSLQARLWGHQCSQAEKAPRAHLLVRMPALRFGLCSPSLMLFMFHVSGPRECVCLADFHFGSEPFSSCESWWVLGQSYMHFHICIFISLCFMNNAQVWQ